MQHIHITGIPQNAEHPIWKCEYVSWPIRKLLPDDRFRKYVVGNTYVDYMAVLDVEEALALNACFKEHWRQQNEDLNRLLLAHRSTHRMVYVRIVEEDSMD
jgi:hypothetical protein